MTSFPELVKCSSFPQMKIQMKAKNFNPLNKQKGPVHKNEIFTYSNESLISYVYLGVLNQGWTHIAKGDSTATFVRDPDNFIKEKRILISFISN